MKKENNSQPNLNQVLKNIANRKRIAGRYLDKACLELLKAEMLTDEIFIRSALVQKRNEIIHIKESL